MEFIERINMFHTSDGLDKNGLNYGLSSISAYNWFLKLEEQRSLRSRGGVCTLNISFKNISLNRHDPIFEECFSRVWQRVIKSVIAQTRTSDIVFLSDEQMKLILTETLKNGACCAAKRFCRIVLSVIEKEPMIEEKSELTFELDIKDYKEKKIYKISILNDKTVDDICDPKHLTISDL